MILAGLDALDLFTVALLVGKELANASLPGADIGEEFFQTLDAPVGECRDALFAAATGKDHLAIVDIVRVAGDFLDEFEVFADQRSGVADRVDVRSRPTMLTPSWMLSSK